ncbi:MAG TPA: DNRLRE domain-containing protein, partial [Planctomycetota bacterium]|nr:DNRLRE domain-containing protein [Planctomycetota bacterium]
LQVEPAFNPGDVEFEYSSILADSEEPGTCSLESNGSSATLTVDGRSAVAFEDLFEIAWVDTIAGPVSPPYSASVAARTERFDQNGGIEEHCGDCVHGVTSHEVTHDEIFLPWAGAGTSFEVPLPAGDYNPAISTILWHEGHWTRWSHDCASEPYFYPSGPGLWEIFVKASEPVGESCGQPLVNRYCAHHRLIVYAADAVAPYGPPYYVAVNDDDDNCNGIPDLNDAAVPGDNDLLWFRVTFTPPLSFLRSRGAALEVETNKVRLYVTPDKSVPFDANIPAHLADQLYIEAISPSSQADDASFTLRLTAPSAAPFEKTVSLTSFQVLAVEIDDPEVEGADFRTCDGAIFGTVAPTLRVHYAPAIPQITDSLGIRVGNRNLRPYLTFDQGYASGIIPAPGEEDSFGYYAGRNETTVVLGAGSLTFHRDYVSFHYIISDDPVPGGGMQFLQHEDMLSNLVQQGSDYIVDGLVVAQFEPEITDARLSQIIRGENLLVVALQRYYQVLVVRARSYQDQQAIRDYLAALPEEPYVFIPGAYNYDPATGDFEWERAALDSEVNLAAFVNVPPTPPDYFVSHPTFNTPIFLMHEPSADAHVAGGDSQNTNFGTEPLLEIDSAQDPGAVRKLAYMAFDLREVRKLVGTVELYFILMAEAADSVSLYALDDDTWQEDTITYATAPNLNPDGTLDPNGIQLITQIALDEQDPIANRQFIVDVTDFVTAQFQGDKIASFILYSEADGLISIASREYTGCEPFLYFDPPELPEDSEFVAGASFTNVNDEKIKAVFDPLKGTWYNVETLRSAGLLETRLKDGEAVDFIDWSKVDESVPGLSAPDQATLFLQTHISFSSDPMISKFIDDQARLTMGLMEYTDAGDITFSVLKGDFKGAGFAVGAAVIPGLSRKTILKGVGKLGTITGVTKTRAFRIGEAGLRRVMKKLNLKKAQVMVKGRLRTWKPRKWGFDAVFEKGDNLVLAKMDDTVVLDPNTFDLIIGEAKGGTSRLGGVWRRFVGGDKRYLQQMGSDGDWVRDVIRRMRQHGDDVDRAMADKLEQALSNGRLQGLIASTPIKDAVVQETKVVQVLFDP